LIDASFANATKSMVPDCALFLVHRWPPPLLLLLLLLLRNATALHHDVVCRGELRRKEQAGADASGAADRCIRGAAAFLTAFISYIVGDAAMWPTSLRMHQALVSSLHASLSTCLFHPQCLRVHFEQPKNTNPKKTGGNWQQYKKKLFTKK
jgi:hypothetical protein